MCTHAHVCERGDVGRDGVGDLGGWRLGGKAGYQEEQQEELGSP